jgi:hypothetical protein
VLLIPKPATGCHREPASYLLTWLVYKHLKNYINIILWTQFPKSFACEKSVSLSVCAIPFLSIWAYV